MVANVTLVTTHESMIYGDLDSFTQLQNGNFLLSQPYFKELNDNGFQINEFRFFCHKPSHGRTIHIASTSSSDGKEWVQYLIGQAIHSPLRSNVFRRLEGDNSFLAQSNEIGYALHFTQRVYDHQLYVPWNYFFVIADFSNNRRFYCDDLNSNPGVWQVYIR